MHTQPCMYGDPNIAREDPRLTVGRSSTPNPKEWGS